MLRKRIILLVILIMNSWNVIYAQSNPIIVQGNNFADKQAWLQAFTQSNGNYIIEVRADESISSQRFEYGGRDNIIITIKSIGANRTISYSSYGGNLFYIPSGVTLVLDGNITLRGGGVYVGNGGVLRMNNGSTITGGKPGVCVYGTFEMNGGNISGNDNAIFDSSSGMYYKNRQGAGVAVYGGNFTMSGGTISGNDGSGVSLGGDEKVMGFSNQSVGTFSMVGGTISGNKNGGVQVNSYNYIGAAMKGRFIMNGGTISGNDVGGVIVKNDEFHGNANFNMNNGTISNNKGSGVSVDGAFIMSGGTISGNATDNGGGVYVGGTFTMNDGIISGNTAKISGGGVFIAGTFVMRGGSISGNTANAYGGGVFVGNNNFSKTGGIITGYTNDQKNGNVVRDSSRNVLNFRGHAVYAGSSSSVIKIQETSIGSFDDLSYNGNSNPVVFTGNWTNNAANNNTAGNNNARQQLRVFSFNDELANMVKNYYRGTHPNVEVDYLQTPSDQFQGKLDPALQSGQGVPDIIALESAFVRKYVESGLLLDITDIYEANKGKLLAYPVEVGTYKGKVYAMSWQACPGAMFYRRSLAKKYLGTDDPKIVQSYFNNFNNFLVMAQFLNQKSNGSCVVVSSLGDLRNSFLSARKDSWIMNGKLVIDPAMEQYMDICKILHDNQWEGCVGQWSDGWFAGMKGELRDEYNRRIEVFSYFLPTWGLHYVLKTNVPETSGDWAMIQGPSSYRWGGTWVGAYKGTTNVAAVKEFIRYITTDDVFLEAWAKDTGDMVSNTNVINKIKGTYSEPFLGGQNHYAEFAEMAKSVNGRLLQVSDEVIEAMFDEELYNFVNGEKTKAQALADFKAQAEAWFTQ